MHKPRRTMPTPQALECDPRQARSAWWSFDANGDTTMDVMSGFKVVKADAPIGCKFEFAEVLK
jgi:hypothetical protein